MQKKFLGRTYNSIHNNADFFSKIIVTVLTTLERESNFDEVWSNYNRFHYKTSLL